MRLVVVSGTGTEIGKTHFAAALLLAWRDVVPGAAIAGLKPVESGVAGANAHANALGPDAATLGRLSTFHVKRFPPPYMLRRPVSPHLAARDEGLSIELERIVRYVRDATRGADGAVVELPGGLFSPLGDALSNADVVAALAADGAGAAPREPARELEHVLVAPDRLGMLHDVVAAVRACTTVPGARPTGIVLVTPAVPDASTSTNAAELARVTDVPVLAVLPRAPIEELARLPALRAVASHRT